MIANSSLPSETLAVVASNAEHAASLDHGRGVKQ
jgi:hypothetical protein